MNTEIILFFISGLFLFCIQFFFIKKIEKEMFVPSFWFFITFFMHAYLDPLMRFNVDIHFNKNSFPTLSLYTILSNILLIFGYMVSFLGLSKTKLLRNSRSVELTTIFREREFLLTAIFITSAFIFLMISLYFIGGFQLSKGHFAYKDEGFHRKIITISYLFYSFVPSLFLSAYKDFESSDKKKYNKIIAYFMLVLVSIYAYSNFGRQTILMVLLIVIILYYNRVRKFKASTLLLLFFALLLTTAFALLRRLGTGIANVSYQDILFLYDENVFDLWSIMAMIFTILPGQAVFSNVISIIDSGESLKYGITYLESILSLIFPMGEYTGYERITPAFWFKDAYAPNLEGHGFDFSMLAESYLNFSWFGVLIFLLLGFLVSVLSRIIRFSTNPVYVIWACIVLVSLIVGLRNDSNAMFTRIGYLIIPFMLWYYIVLRFLRRKK